MIRTEWNRFAALFPAPAAQRRQVGEALMRRYGARGRHYHTLTHIAAMLELCNEFERKLRDAAQVRAAIWFHDAVYATRRGDNEERSRQLALVWTRRLGHECRDGADLILATKRHRLEDVAEELREDAAWFLDFDLAILGSAPAAYDEYAAAIRREYRWVPAAAYAEGRAKVLRAFSGRPQIYLTAPLRRRWETAARRNLDRELARLTRSR